MGDKNNILSRRARVLVVLTLLFATGLMVVSRLLTEPDVPDSSNGLPGGGLNTRLSPLLTSGTAATSGPAPSISNGTGSRDATGSTSTPDAPPGVSPNASPVNGAAVGVPRSSTRLAEAPQLPPPVPEKKVTVQEYLDPLIDPSKGVDTPLAISPTGRAAGLLPGLASIEYRYFDEKIHDGESGSYIERGLAAQVQQDTENSGRFDLRSAFTNVGSNGIVSSDFNGGHFVNLAQRDFAVADRWLMNNEIGDIRARSPDLFTTTGYIRFAGAARRGRLRGDTLARCRVSCQRRDARHLPGTQLSGVQHGFFERQRRRCRRVVSCCAAVAGGGADVADA